MAGTSFAASALPHCSARSSSPGCSRLSLVTRKLCAGATSVSPCRSSSFAMAFFFQAEDGIRDGRVTGVQTLLFRSPAALYVIYRFVVRPWIKDRHIGVDGLL